MSDKRKQARAIFFSAIMVLSMVAFGAAGFAGSAAALTEQTDDSSNPISGTAGGLVSSNPADPGATGATHTITVLNESTGDSIDFAATNVENVTVIYDDSDALSSLSSTNGLTANGEISLSIGGAGISDSGNEVTVTKESGNTLKLTNINTAASESLDAGEGLTLTLTNVDNPDSTTDVTVNVRNTTGASGQISSTQTLELPGAVERYNDQRSASGTPDGNFTTITDALSAADDDDYISVGAGEYREFGNTLSISDNNVTIVGTNQPFLNVSADPVIDVTGGENISIENFEIRPGVDDSTTIDARSSGDTVSVIDSTVFVRSTGGNAFGLDTNQRPLNVNNVRFEGIVSSPPNEGYAIRSSGGTDGTTIVDSTFESVDNGILSTDDSNALISNNIFANISDGGVRVVGTGGTVSNVTVDSNTFTNVGSSAGTDGGIDVENNGGTVNKVNITTNTIQGDGDEIAISVDGGEVDILNNDVSDTQNGTDVRYNNVEGAVDVQGNTYTNTSTGFFIAGGSTSQPVNINLNTFDNGTQGVVVNSDFDQGNDVPANVTFNDFVDNGNNGLLVGDISDTSDSVNANYSWWDNRDSSRIVGPYTPQDAESQLLSPRRVYSYTRLHTGGQP